MLLMAKRPGRERRQDVVRDSEGRIDRSEYRREDVRAPAAWNRLRDVAQEMGIDPRLATQAGKLFYNLQITPVQFETAVWWAEMLNDYDRIKIGGSRTPRPPSFEMRSPGEGSAHLSAADAETLRRFMDARSALTREGGQMVEYGVCRLCRNEGVGAFFDEAIKGLDILVAHRGLTGARKSRRR